MKKGIKIALITALILLGIGIMLIAVAFCMVGFELSGWNGFESVTNTHQIKESFTDINIHVTEADVKIEVSDTGKAYAVCHETDQITHSVNVENGTLKIIRHDRRAWWEHIGIFWAEMSVTLYLPEEEYGDVNCQNVSGKLYLDRLDADDVRMNTVSGEIEIGELNCNALSCKTTSGDITLSDIASKGNIALETTSGEVEWERGSGNAVQISTVSGNVCLEGCMTRGDAEIRTTSGEIRMQMCDAENLTLSSTSGNINVGLLSEKQFSANSKRAPVGALLLLAEQSE